MEHLFEVWPEMSERMKAADQILLLTDFDGTLSPIVGRPEEAVLPQDTRHAMKELLASKRVGLAVISGRALTDIKEKVGIDGITYAGNHGIEIEGPWLKFVYPPAEALRPVIQRLHLRLREALASFEGAIVEDKGLTLSIHYRLLRGDRVIELSRVCEEAVRGLRSQGKVRTTEGKKVYEIRPGVLWDKEDAILLLMSGWTSPRSTSASLAIFLGDDLTDEGGFKVVNAHGGVPIFVGDSAATTAARYFLRSPDEVRDLLHRLAHVI